MNGPCLLTSCGLVVTHRYPEGTIVVLRLYLSSDKMSTRSSRLGIGRWGAHSPYAVEGKLKQAHYTPGQA
jgi:hypothetical protein